ncbi:MAG: hypothetical protein ACM3TR_15010 [Caulobacteraceae bacterium]
MKHCEVTLTILKESNKLVETAVKYVSEPLYTPFVFEQGVLGHIKEPHISLADYLEGAKTNI